MLAEPCQDFRGFRHHFLADAVSRQKENPIVLFARHRPEYS
jgi:hypothetical protein